MSEIHRIKCGNGNCYIVENGTGAILVDTGKKEYIDKVLDACKFYNVKLLVLTHAHFDHAENAAQISDTLGIPIAMNENDCNLIKSNSNQDLYATNIFGKLVIVASVREFSSRPMPEFEPSLLLRDGDSLSNYGIDAQIIPLPGHTDGSIGIDVDGKHLIVGDALMNMFFPSVSLLYHNRDEMLKSARKISSLGDRTIYFGHGKALPNRQWTK